MGRGRKPKPAALRLLASGRLPSGKPSRRPTAVLDAPSWLPPDALELWQEVVPPLCAAGVLLPTDRAVVSGYCCCWSTWRSAMRDIAEHGSTYRTKGGLTKRNPAMAIADSALALMLRFAAEIGCTPTSRRKLDIGTGELRSELQAFIDRKGS